MKIILEPTESKTHNKVTIENKDDDLVFDDVVELVRSALVAWGFHPETVNRYFDGE